MSWDDVIIISDSGSEDDSPSKRLKVSTYESESEDSDVVIIYSEKARNNDILPENVKVMDKTKSPVKVKPEVGHNADGSTMLHGIKQLPIYARPTKMLTTQEAVGILLSSELNDLSISSRVPFSVETNSVFIIDLNKLASPNDVTCDDMGVWTWGGSRKRWVSVEEDGYVTFLKSAADSLDFGESCYLVWKRYYSLKSSPDVKRMIIILEDCDNDTLNLAMIQYHFSQGEHKLKVAPHGNSHSGESYVRTMPSMMCKLKEEAKKSTPKRALQFMSSEAGGILKATSAGALPRNRQQVKDARRKEYKEDFDPLYSVMHMCKEAQGKGGDLFVRMVNAAPFPMMLISFDYTLNDLVRFCTCAENFSILGVDPTFNLGDFDVTVTTYRHLLLCQYGNQTGKPPVMLGPLFIHVRKDFTAYHFFSSALVGQRQELKSLRAYGTDGELALGNALSATFPRAQHVRCFLHFRDNIQRKLQELSCPRSIVNEIVKDIMGCPTQLQRGLVDAKDVEEMDDMLIRLKNRWNELERPYNSPPYFHAWFIKHCRNTVAKYMLPEVREKAGLGSPPSPYYTNEVESKNKVLKQEVQYKSSQLPEFVDEMKVLMEEQRHEIERAVVNMGEYRLRTEYRHLAVESSKWFKMSTDQCKKKIDKFMKASVERSVNRPSCSDCPLDSLAIHLN